MSRCKESVMRGYHMGKCLRNAVKDGYCKQHHPDSIAERDRLRQVEWDRQQDNSIYSRFARLQERNKELQAQLRDIKLMAKPVCATAKNTSAVRTGHELGGYIKHYIVPTHLIIALQAILDKS